eukprot:CAMPEP_0177652574 /NCGR_PEP_ID=MMETSP0447-20121125/13211_1 /TAXON_ID=0 /ORGANISM="Stygamoeba regulata, Strain BSH-02190019" /LENGTH=365 /DNA_ID=CAMNT_0019155845 /DNA_START=211 /DNA_END=1308 /DNA_ORIENTATION=+
MPKPNVLILGGVGFIGRNLVEFLIESDCCGKIRVADKVLPQTAGLSEKQKQYFEKIEFKQSNLARTATISKVFDDEANFDYVINLAGETKYSQADEVYKENIYDVTVTCASEAAKRNVKRFIEVSTAQVYDSGNKARAEDAKLKPWTGLAKQKLKAEEQLKSIEGLKYIIVRPSTVYGPGDLSGLMPRMIAAAVYKTLNEKLEFLWAKDLAINTVHVRDVAAALWHLCEHGEDGQVYNLSDSGSTDQGKIAKSLESIFGISAGFMGNIQSKLATSIAMKQVAETANDKHLKPWSDLCKAQGITNTPLTPYLDEELLYNNPLSIDGTAITKTGFTYKYPEVTDDLLRESLKYFIDIGFFPGNILKE